MALEDYLESEVVVAVAATAAVMSPRVRGVLRSGAVYGLAGMLRAGDAISSVARNAAPGVQQAANVAAGTVQNAAHQAAASAGNMVEGATEAVRRKAEELGLVETPTIRVTEAARRKAEEMGVALAGLQGTGAGGQITVEDVKKRARAERP